MYKYLFPFHFQYAYRVLFLSNKYPISCVFSHTFGLSPVHCTFAKDYLFVNVLNCLHKRQKGKTMQTASTGYKNAQGVVMNITFITKNTGQL